MADLIVVGCVAEAAVLLPSLLMTVWHLRLTLAALFMPSFKTTAVLHLAGGKENSRSAQIAKTFSIPIG
jgi:hypothetical protein